MMLPQQMLKATTNVTFATKPVEGTGCQQFDGMVHLEIGINNYRVSAYATEAPSLQKPYLYNGLVEFAYESGYNLRMDLVFEGFVLVFFVNEDGEKKMELPCYVRRSDLIILFGEFFDVG